MRPSLSEFEKRFLDMKNESLDFGQDTIVRHIRNKLKPNWNFWSRILPRSTEDRIDSNLISATLVGDVGKVNRLMENGGATNLAMLCSTVIAGVVRNEEIFTILGKFLMENMEVDTIIGILNPAHVRIPLFRILLFVWVVELILFVENGSVIKPTVSHMRLAVYWRSWETLACFTLILDGRHLTPADFVVNRAARVIQRAWRKRRQR